MSRFFDYTESIRHSADMAAMAAEYGRFLWKHDRAARLLKDKQNDRARFYMGLSVVGDNESFERVTKRAALISDTLLLSHEATSKLHDLGRKGFLTTGPKPGMSVLDAYGVSDPRRRTNYGIHCPSLRELGSWLVDTERLLRAGLSWYLPTYSILEPTGARSHTMPAERAKAVDYLIKDGRAIDMSGANPIKSRLIRPILTIDLPFIDGVGLRDFSQITVDEFDSYSALRDFLRLRLLDLDTAMTAVDSERALTKLGLEIKNEIRAFQSEMESAKRKRLLIGSGAAIGTVSAALIGVYGEALQAAVTTIGATGGIWSFITSLADNDTKSLRQDKWNYAWILSRKADY